MSKEANPVAPSTNYALAMTSDETTDTARRYESYASMMVQDDHNPNDPSKHGTLPSCGRAAIERKYRNYPRGREYFPTIEELRAFRKVYDAILAAGNRGSIVKQLGGSSELIYKA